MKRLLLFGWMVGSALAGFAQRCNCTVNFEDPIWWYSITVEPDTISNPNCIWQIGKPGKTVFDSAHSYPNVLVTDTFNPYPVNDTSRIEFAHTASGGWTAPHMAGIAGYYQVDSDTLTDFGTIEVSPDNGTTWIDILNDSVYASHVSWAWSGRPVFSGNSHGWQSFEAQLYSIAQMFQIELGDTIRYRFTFISDSVQSNKDGLMFDDLGFMDHQMSIPSIQNPSLISISPNPASTELRIQKSGPASDDQQVQIFNSLGEIVFEDKAFAASTIDTRAMENGVYLLKFSDGKSFAMKRFVVQR